MPRRSLCLRAISAILLLFCSEFAFSQTPTLTSISPAALSPGMQVTFTGSGFGSAQGSGSVGFNNTAGTVVSWSDTQVVATVAAGTNPGNAWITQNGTRSNYKAFTMVPPVLSSISPTALSPGMQVTFTGSGFGSAQGSGSVGFNNTAGTVVGWSDTQVVATVAAGTNPGNAWVTQNGTRSNYKAFTMVPPMLASISPTTLSPGMQVTFAGSGFGTTQGSGSVGFNNTAGTVVSWSDTQVVAMVATGTNPGNAWVTQNGTRSNYVTFTMVPPTLTSISPTALSPGMQVTFTGSGFGALQGSGSVGFNNTAGTVVSWSDTQVAATVAAGTNPGNAWVTQNGTRSNYKAFTMVPPVLSSISPTALSPRMQVVFTGSGFGATQGSGSVGFNNTAGTVVSWSDTQVVATVAAATNPGNAWITQNGTRSNYTAFTMVPPTLTSISSTALSPGMQVTFTGSGFGVTQGSGSVGFNNQPGTVVNWSDTQVVATVAAATNPGNAWITQNGTRSNYKAFTMVPPTLSSISPTALTPGMQVTFTGSGFGVTQGSGGVGFNNTAGTVVSWSDTQVVATVATGTNPGNAWITQNGTRSNYVAFTVVSLPLISSLSTSTGTVGTSVTITGTNFGATQGTSTVLFNGTLATDIVNWSSTSIVAAVPAGATTGNVVVAVNGVASNGFDFTVQSGDFVPTLGSMTSSRYGETATRLTTGQVLITGGMSTSGVLNTAELYNPASQTFTAINAMNVPRWMHTATLLNDGTVLIAGGSDLANEETLDSAEIYNPATETFTLLTNTLNTARVGHTSTLLNNGQVLIVGGYDPDTGLIADGELYDPPTQTFIDLGDTNAPRFGHTATVLQNGQVLITGGEVDPVPSAAYNSAEIFNPVTQTFTPVPVPMMASREGHAAILLNNGQVLITGGDNPPTGSLNSAELYDPSSSTFAAVPSFLTAPRISHDMTVLNGGKVLITGGATDVSANSTPLNTAELYDPVSQSFTSVDDMTSVREHQTVTLLNDGTALVTGGTDGSNIFNSAELYVSSHLNALTSINVTPVAPSSGAGLQQSFTAVGKFSDGSSENLASVIWTSSALSVAAVSNDATNPGVAASTTQGTTTITASAAGVSGSATLTVTAPTLISITLSPSEATLPLGATQQFTATGVYSDGSTQDLTGTAIWSSSASVVTVINSSGVAAGLFQGTATIQVSFGSVNASTTLTVAAPALASITLTPATTAVALGSGQQYQAIGTYTDGSAQDVTTLLTWSSSAPAVATINTNGLVATVGQGSATLTGSFESISATASLTVTAPNLLSLTVVPNAASLSSGSTQQLNAIGNYSDGSTQNLTASSSWASSNPSVIGIGSTGLATTFATGNATITATSESLSGMSVLIVTSGTTQASLNTSRYQHSATLLNNGQLLVAGGISCPSAGSCTYLNSAELYNPATATFTNTGSMGTARSAPTVLLNNGKVLVAGGYTCDGSGNCSSLSSAEIYDPVAGTFSSAGTMTVARSGQTMTILADGTVLVAGGENCISATSCSALQTAEIYNANAGIFVAISSKMIAARYGASAVLLNSGSVLIAGGFNGTTFPVSAEIYSPASNGFIQAAPKLNIPRFNASATLLNNGQVLVAGGSTCALPGCPTNVAEIYDPIANTFGVVGSGMNVARFNHTATLLTNGDVGITGGFSSCGSACTSEASTEFYDPVAGVFTSSDAMSGSRAGHTGTLLANGEVLLAGGINAGITLTGDEWYQPTTLTPVGLVSVAITPSSLLLIPGQNQQFMATGTFNDGSTQTLQSVIWSSSNPSAARISNSIGNSGVVNAIAIGLTTITATAGTIGDSANLKVAGLVSLVINPSNPTLAISSGQQLTSTGTFSDGSTQDLTTSVTWASSNNSIVLIGTASGFQGFALGASVGTANITATLGSLSVSTLVTVQAVAAGSNPPTIASVSPTTGVAGMQVTILGSGFGSAQGIGRVWLGSAYGTVVSWSDTQIVTTVASISTSGTVQVQQGGLSSNAIPFNVNTATIGNITPSSGVPGTAVTISGSGFGPVQGSGQIWLGTATGVVQSWSDSQIVAIVATGSTSGAAEILQNGVMSNSVYFEIDTFQITDVEPPSGAPGTAITITGTGFGTSQGNGEVWLGSTNGQIMSWSDTQVVAVVAPDAVSGVARIQQSGIWSNGFSFIVPNSNGESVNVVPDMLNLVVGETHAIQALDANGKPIRGASWTSSNNNVIALSTDDPPILTAVGVGRATVTAGASSADVIVSLSSTISNGDVIWSNPGDGSGVNNIVPAVPSASGVADVFAFQSDGTVAAIKSDGTTAWTASVGTTNAMPDFQGGLVLATPQSIMKLDGTTGAPYPAYTAPTQNDSLSAPAIHTDGTIFTVDASNNSASVIGIDPTTGNRKFTVQFDQSKSTGACTGNDCGSSSNYNDSSAPTVLTSPMVAGDGYAYVTYEYSTINQVSQENATGYLTTNIFGTVSCPLSQSVNWNADTKTHLMLLRIGSDGSSSKIDLKDWESRLQENALLTWSSTACGVRVSNSEAIASTGNLPADLSIEPPITNGDTGILLSWKERTDCGWCNYAQTSPPPDQTGYAVATTSGDTVATLETVNIPGQTSAITPVLQAQDGTFVGTVVTGTQANMISFDTRGNIKWSVPNDYPQLATADGGVIGSSGIAYNSNGNATTQNATTPIQSWRGNQYQFGSVDQVSGDPILMATTLWAQAGANPSGTPTASRPWQFVLIWQNDFNFIPSSPNVRSNLTVDITADSAMIKAAALKELQDAYQTDPVTVRVVEGTPKTGDHRATVLNHQTLVTSADCGATQLASPKGLTDSQVDYINNMENAQIALGIVINNSQDEKVALHRIDLMQAIGRGIGTSAAHEIAHHFLVLCCDMDANPQQDLQARGTFNATGCDGAMDPSPWTGYWPGNPKIYLHWEPDTQKGLSQCLSKGWQDFGQDACHN